ncbi:hypothetical protein, partial [Streptomyces sp. NPDC041003]|uniref:hypothetical protein n=1 Tax=Streptomyces sp. NPDC041003 TaxID=3155730 RepID=UPI0033FC034B
MLCLGGGTGIAPIKALIEDVAEHGERRPVAAFSACPRTGLTSPSRDISCCSEDAICCVRRARSVNARGGSAP